MYGIRNDNDEYLMLMRGIDCTLSLHGMRSNWKKMFTIAISFNDYYYGNAISVFIYLFIHILVCKQNN